MSSPMDLTEAERLLRAHADDTVPVPVLYDSERAAIVLVLGELDRLRAIEQRARELLAALDDPADIGPRPRTMREGMAEDLLRAALRRRAEGEQQPRPSDGEETP